MAHEAGGLPISFGANVPDVFADDTIMFDIVNGTLRITFGVVAPTEPAAPSPIGMCAIGRLILPMESAQRLSLGLYDYLKQKGFDPASLGASGQTQQ